MYKVGLGEKDEFVPVRSSSGDFTPSEIRKTISDVILNSPSQRLVNPKKANSFIKFLNSRGVVHADLTEPVSRKSRRTKRR